MWARSAVLLLCIVAMFSVPAICAPHGLVQAHISRQSALEKGTPRDYATQRLRRLPKEAASRALIRVRFARAPLAKRAVKDTIYEFLQSKGITGAFGKAKGALNGLVDAISERLYDLWYKFRPAAPGTRIQSYQDWVVGAGPESRLTPAELDAILRAHPMRRALSSSSAAVKRANIDYAILDDAADAAGNQVGRGGFRKSVYDAASAAAGKAKAFGSAVGESASTVASKVAELGSAGWAKVTELASAAKSKVVGLAQKFKDSAAVTTVSNKGLTWAAKTKNVFVQPSSDIPTSLLPVDKHHKFSIDSDDESI